MGSLTHPITMGGGGGKILKELDANTRPAHRGKLQQHTKTISSHSEGSGAINAVKTVVSSTGRGCQSILVTDPGSIIGTGSKTLSWVGGSTDTRCVLEMIRNKHTYSQRPYLKIFIIAHSLRSCPKICAISTSSLAHSNFKEIHRFAVGKKSEEFSCFLPMATIDRYLMIQLVGGSGHHHRIARLEVTQRMLANQPPHATQSNSKQEHIHVPQNKSSTDLTSDILRSASPIEPGYGSDPTVGVIMASACDRIFDAEREETNVTVSDMEANAPPKTASSPQCAWGMKYQPDKYFENDKTTYEGSSESLLVGDISASRLFGDGGPLAVITPEAEKLAIQSSNSLTVSPATKTEQMLSDSLRNADDIQNDTSLHASALQTSLEVSKLTSSPSPSKTVHSVTCDQIINTSSSSSDRRHHPTGATPEKVTLSLNVQNSGEYNLPQRQYEHDFITRSHQAPVEVINDRINNNMLKGVQLIDRAASLTNSNHSATHRQTSLSPVNSIQLLPRSSSIASNSISPLRESNGRHTAVGVITNTINGVLCSNQPTLVANAGDAPAQHYSPQRTYEGSHVKEKPGLPITLSPTEPFHSNKYYEGTAKSPSGDYYKTHNVERDAVPESYAGTSAHGNRHVHGSANIANPIMSPQLNEDHVDMIVRNQNNDVIDKKTFYDSITAGDQCETEIISVNDSNVTFQSEMVKAIPTGPRYRIDTSNKSIDKTVIIDVEQSQINDPFCYPHVSQSKLQSPQYPPEDIHEFNSHPSQNLQQEDSPSYLNKNSTPVSGGSVSKQATEQRYPSAYDQQIDRQSRYNGSPYHSKAESPAYPFEEHVNQHQNPSEVGWQPRSVNSRERQSYSGRRPDDDIKKFESYQSTQRPSDQKEGRLFDSQTNDRYSSRSEPDTHPKYSDQNTEYISTRRHSQHSHSPSDVQLNSEYSNNQIGYRSQSHASKRNGEPDEGVPLDAQSPSYNYNRNQKHKTRYQPDDYPKGNSYEDTPSFMRRCEATPEQGGSAHSGTPPSISPKELLATMLNKSAISITNTPLRNTNVKNKTVEESFRSQCKTRSVQGGKSDSQSTPGSGKPSRPAPKAPQQSSRDRSGKSKSGPPSGAALLAAVPNMGPADKLSNAMRTLISSNIQATIDNRSPPRPIAATRFPTRPDLQLHHIGIDDMNLSEIK